MSATIKNNTKFTLILMGVIAIIAVSLFSYLMWYTSPDQIEERVKVIANTDDGCIVETLDGYAINVGPCDFEPNEYIIAPIDQKLKERAALMNPTR
jgi:flagellar biosynthesis/type III secretory pathway M-ring protein FliF/YscJ